MAVGTTTRGSLPFIGVSTVVLGRPTGAGVSGSIEGRSTRRPSPPTTLGSERTTSTHLGGKERTGRKGQKGRTT